MKIQSTNSVSENKIKCVVSGLSGAGKTSLAKTIKAAGYNPLIISFESGLLSIVNSSIDFVDGTKDDEGKLIAKELRINRLMEVYRYILSDEAKKKYNVIYVDSLTEVCQCLFDALRKEYPDNKDNLVVYGLLAQKMRDLLKAFRDIPDYHVVFSCLTKIEKDADGRRFAGFDLIGSISDKLAGFFDEVLYLKVNADGTRNLICNSSENVIAKDRSGKLNLVESPDLGMVFNKILNVTTKEKK